MATRSDVPSYDDLMNPTLRALHRLGGSGSIQEIMDEIIQDLDLRDDVTDLPHGRGSQTEVEYRAAWARTYLKNFGLIENSERGVWALTADGQKLQEVDQKEVVRAVQQEHRRRRRAIPDQPGEDDEQDWRAQLISVLLGIDAAAFERLCQRLLRESGFIEVEVTGRSGDGGIDGQGIFRIADLISFPVIFQAKRHTENIGPRTVRDFRGAMIGRADKGLIITTAGFTRDAWREATRDGAPPIDLIDGDLLASKLKSLGLGVRTEVVEEVTVDEDWFRAI